MQKVITRLEDVTAEWLTDVLMTSGALTAGAVGSFEVDGGAGNWSQNGVLTLQYNAAAEGERPERLFLKLVDTDTGDGEYFDDSEVTYYTRDYVGVENVPLMRCYAAAYSAEQLRYHVLLEDVSQTHEETQRKRPTLEYGKVLAEGLAAMHAHWWGDSRLEDARAPIHSAAHIRHFVEIAEPGSDNIIGAYAAELKPHWPELMREIYAHHPQKLIERTADPEGFTLIHGDVNPNNVMVPREGERPLYIIDRQPFDWSLTTWLGVYDLAYLMVIFWASEERRRLERPVLEHYHACLVAQGVANYSWEQLWHDYRLMAAMGVYIATEWCRGGVSEGWKDVWMYQLQQSLTACDDLNCRELWM